MVNRIPTDLGKRWRHQAVPNTFFQRPNTYSIVLPLFAGVPTCLGIQGDQSQTPAVTFEVQSDLDNTGLISIGDSNTSLTNGLQLDPGGSHIFSTLDQNLMPGSFYFYDLQYENPEEYIEHLDEQKRATFKRPPVVLLNISDFYAASTKNNQRVRIFWSIFTRA